MKSLHYDCFAGISGDMNLGAMIDLGMPVAHLVDNLRKLCLDGWELSAEPFVKSGIRSTMAKVMLTEENHAHDHHSHHEHHHSHSRSLPEIESLIDQSELSPFVKELSKRIFTVLGNAEAKIHGIPVEKVHFHEVGAVDAIVDIVGAAIAVEYFSPDRITCSRIELGSGTVKCAHGILPVPAPATVAILSGIPVNIGGTNIEATTPTGAAILKAIVDEFTDAFCGSIDKIGIGAGHKDGTIPNILRVMFVDNKSDCEVSEEYSVEVVANIDDMSPEYLAAAVSRLLEVGADDAWIVPIVMKKGRAASQIFALCNSHIVNEIEKVIFSETSSIGLRRRNVTKRILRRESFSVSTALGEVRVKRAMFDGQEKIKPEFDDLQKLAERNGLSLPHVLQSVTTEIDKMRKESK